MTMLGKIPWNKGKNMPHSKEWEAKRLESVREAAKRRIYPYGYTRPDEYTRPMIEKYRKLQQDNPEKYREIAIRNLSRNKNMSLAKENSPNWEGGKTDKNGMWRNNNRSRLTKWRNSVLARDDHTCKQCRSKEKLEAHHIIPIKSNPAFAFLRMNGVTLCRKCHKETDSFGGKRNHFKNSDIGQTKAHIQFIPHSFQDYETVGNWGIGENGEILIFVSEMSDDRMGWCVAFHELSEVLLCLHRGIKQEDVDAFDIQFEKEREEGLHGEDEEPGDAKDAPYKSEHFFATTVERQLTRELGLDWKEYDDAVMSL